MKRLWKIVYSRTFLVVLTIVLTVVLFYSIYQRAVEVFPYAYTVLALFSILVALSIINKPMNTSFKLSWILFVVIVPVFGALLYFLLKTNIETRRYEKSFKKQAATLREYSRVSPKVLEALTETDKGQLAFTRYMSDYAGAVMHSNTSAVYYPTGEAFYEALLDELRQAKDYIFMEYFIVDFGEMWGSILEILKEKAAQGVEVRFLYDGSNSLTLLPYSYYKTLRSYGLKAKVFSQIIPALSTVQNNRDHRKITVIDGKVAFTGGANLADEYINRIERFGHWKDAAVKVEGEAVLTFTQLFLQMWNFDEKGQVDDRRYLTAIQESQTALVEGSGFYMPYGESPFDDEDVAKRVYLDIIQSAQESLYIMTPYLVLDDEMLDNLLYAAKRGVKVTLLLPHIYDKKLPYLLARTDFERYLQAGIAIYEYTPGFLHSKVIWADGKRASVGTVNMDFRSLYLNFECGLYIYDDKEVLAAIEQDLLETQAQSQLIDQTTFSTYSPLNRLAGAVLKMLSPLM